MMSTELVSKEEALQLVEDHINRPGVMDLPVFIELLKWRDKLTRWLLKEQAVN